MTAELGARQAALHLLALVLQDGRAISDDPAEGLSSLAPPDRARAQRLALGVLRALSPLERALRPHLTKLPPPAVQRILCLGALELSEGGAPHGVVSAMVDLAKADPRSVKFAGLVNAVLRKLPAPLPLVGENRLPDWLRQPMIGAYGRRGVEAMERVWAKAPGVDLTLRPGASPPPGGLELPSGSWRFAPGIQVSALEGFETGAWWVQDAAAAMVAPALGEVRGKRVLDLCAAPGGKTLQLAAAGARVTALDISGARMQRLAQNLARVGLGAECVLADALDWQPDAPFDAILLDAPCSATGTIRRHPDLPHVKTPKDIASLTQLQAQLLDRALGWLVPGGRLVYATCSLLPAEGEDQIKSALARHPGLAVIRPDLTGAQDDWWTPQGLRLRPDHWAKLGGMDGFFIAPLQANSR